MHIYDLCDRLVRWWKSFLLASLQYSLSYSFEQDKTKGAREKTALQFIADEDMLLVWKKNFEVLQEVVDSIKTIP